MANETPPALLSSLPLWVQAVSIVGFPIIVAVFYMAKDVGYIPSVNTANAEVLSQVTRQHDTMAPALTELVRLNRVTCHNMAKTLEAARECNVP